MASVRDDTDSFGVVVKRLPAGAGTTGARRAGVAPYCDVRRLSKRSAARCEADQGADHNDYVLDQVHPLNSAFSDRHSGAGRLRLNDIIRVPRCQYIINILHLAKPRLLLFVAAYKWLSCGGLAGARTLASLVPHLLPLRRIQRAFAR
jgi:hypothetical protein